MRRIRLPSAGTEKARNLLIEDFVTATEERHFVKSEVKSRWPSYWELLKNNFTYKKLER